MRKLVNVLKILLLYRYESKPPFLQGSPKQAYEELFKENWQLLPVKFCGQLHFKLSKLSVVHFPPFKQGDFKQFNSQLSPSEKRIDLF